MKKKTYTPQRWNCTTQFLVDQGWNPPLTDCMDVLPVFSGRHTSCFCNTFCVTFTRR